jgi:general secretion pathway protein K
LQNNRDRLQAQWLNRSAVDFSRLVLSEDARTSQFDWLGEPWALPLGESKINDFLKDQEIPDEIQGASLIGGLADAQGLFNLTNLWDADFKKVNSSGVSAFGRLLSAIGLDAGLANQLAQLILARGLPLTSVDDLIKVDGFTSNMVENLRQYVCVLPALTTININTASAPVIMAAIPGLSLNVANQLVQQRVFTPLKSPSDIVALLNRMSINQSAGLDLSGVDVKSQFWLARTEVRLGAGVFSGEALIQRSLTPLPTGEFTQVIWDKSNRILSE